MKKIVIVVVAVFCIHNQIFAQETAKTKWMSCAPKNAFGLDLGGGIGKVTIPDNIPTFEIGVRYLHYFTPYVGFDFVKFNSKFNFKKDINSALYGSNISNYFSANVQWMLGVRGNILPFYKCMSVHTAGRVGFGFVYESYENKEYFFSQPVNGIGVGLCLEYEIGLNITRELFIGYACNFQQIRNNDLLYRSMLSHAFRIGINIK